MSSDQDFRLLIQPSDEFLSGYFKWDSFQCYYFSQKNLDKGAENEDAVFFQKTKHGAVFGVCDGVGGHPKGREAAYIAAEEILKAFNDREQEIIYLNILERINEKIRGMKVGAYTTISFGVLINGHVRFFSVGDSEIVYSNNRGRLMYSSVPHSPVGYAVESGLLGQEESLDSPDRNIVSNLLGDEILRFEASSKIELKKGHSFLLATDGLFDNIPKNEVIESISKGTFSDSSKWLEEKLTNLKATNSWRKDDDIGLVYIRKIGS